MEKAKVYFSDFRTTAFGAGLPKKLQKLIREAGIDKLDLEGKFVAIKMHFGELATSAICARTMRAPWRTWSRNWAASPS